MKTWVQVISGLVLLAAGLIAGFIVRIQNPLDPVPIPDDPARIIPSQVQIDAGKLFKLTAKGEKLVTWVLPPEYAQAQLEPVGQTALFVAAEGEYQIGATYSLGDRAADVTWCKVIVGKGPRPPPGPGPGPDPTPPAPIPVAGFRVLILEETAARGQLPPSQLAILTSTQVRAYLKQKTANGTEWRIFDKDAFGASYKDSEIWLNASKRSRASLPWIIISDGKTGFEGQLPQTIDETLTLLKKYGG